MRSIARFEVIRTEPAQDFGGDFAVWCLIDFRRRGGAVFEEIMRLEQEAGGFIPKVFLVPGGRG